MRATGAILILLGIALALAVPLALGGRAGLAGLEHISATGYAALAAVVLAGWLAKAAKLALLVAPFGPRLDPLRSLAISLGADCAFLASPGGVAGYPTNALLLRRAGVSWSAAAAVVAADQILDLAFFAAALPAAAFAWLGVGALFERSASAAVLGISACALLAAALVSATVQRAIRGAARAVFERFGISRERRDRLRRFVSELRQHGRTLASGHPLRVAALLSLTALQWLARYGVLSLALAELGHQVPFSLVLLLQAFIMHVSQWSGIPGGGGAADLALTVALGSLMPAALAATALLVWRIGTFHLVVLAGGVALSREMLRRGPKGPVRR
jgi:uncharacterized protein (TIRG00374 family)